MTALKQLSIKYNLVEDEYQLRVSYFEQMPNLLYVDGLHRDQQQNMVKFKNQQEELNYLGHFLPISNTNPQPKQQEQEQSKSQKKKQIKKLIKSDIDEAHPINSSKPNQPKDEQKKSKKRLVKSDIEDADPIIKNKPEVQIQKQAQDQEKQLRKKLLQLNISEGDLIENNKTKAQTVSQPILEVHQFIKQIKQADSIKRKVTISQEQPMDQEVVQSTKQANPSKVSVQLEQKRLELIEQSQQFIHQQIPDNTKPKEEQFIQKPKYEDLGTRKQIKLDRFFTPTKAPKKD